MQMFRRGYLTHGLNRILAIVKRVSNWEKDFNFANRRQSVDQVLLKDISVR